MNQENATAARMRLIDVLLDAADPNDGGARQPTPLVTAINNDSAYPMQIWHVLNRLVAKGADVSQVSPDWDGGKTSPLGTAVQSGHLDLVIWMLHQSPQADVDKIITGIEAGIKNLAQYASEEHAEEERQNCRPIMEVLQSYQKGDDPPPLSHARQLLMKRQRLAERMRARLRTDRSAPKALLEELAASLSDDSSNDSEAYPSLVPGIIDIELMPETISLIGCESIDWTDTRRVSEAIAEFEKQAFKPAGSFQLADMDHFVQAYVQPFRDLYGTIEQVDDQLFIRVIRPLPNDGFQIATNEELMIDVEVPGFDFIWETREAARSILQHVLSETPDEKPLPASAADFVNHYCTGYRVYRSRLLQVLASEPT